MERSEMVWQGKIGDIPLRVGVPHEGRIIAEWDMPQGARSKVVDSIDELERNVLLQLLLSAGATDTSVTEGVLEAVRKAEEERPRPAGPAAPSKRRKKAKGRYHRRSRRPPLRR